MKKYLFLILLSVLGYSQMTIKVKALYSDTVKANIDTVRIQSYTRFYRPAWFDSTVRFLPSVLFRSSTDTLATKAYARSYTGSYVSIDTIPLSNRISLKVSYSDTAAMLNGRFAKDTLSLSHRIDGKQIAGIYLIPGDSTKVVSGFGWIATQTGHTVTGKIDTSQYATSLKSGFLKPIDWITFNDKQGYINNLGDTVKYKKITDSTNAITGYTTLFQNSKKLDYRTFGTMSSVDSIYWRTLWLPFRTFGTMANVDSVYFATKFPKNADTTAERIYSNLLYWQKSILDTNNLFYKRFANINDSLLNKYNRSDTTSILSSKSFVANTYWAKANLDTANRWAPKGTYIFPSDTNILNTEILARGLIKDSTYSSAGTFLTQSRVNHNTTLNVDSTHYATSLLSGFLKFSDWTIFNSKQVAGTYLIPSDSTILHNEIVARQLITDSAKSAVGYGLLGSQEGHLFTSSLDTSIAVNKAGTQVISGVKYFAANNVYTPLTASRAVVTDANKSLSSIATTATELGYVNGVTSSIQTQIDSKSTIGIFETDSSGDLMPSIAGTYDALYDLDANSDIEPKP